VRFPSWDWQQDAALVGLVASVLGFVLGRLSLRLERAADAAAISAASERAARDTTAAEAPPTTITIHIQRRGSMSYCGRLCILGYNASPADVAPVPKPDVWTCEKCARLWYLDKRGGGQR
jgi:hypothetical protein